MMEAHFGCKEKGYGVILDENSLSHLNDRLFHKEGLTTHIMESSIFSELSFRLLEDTGWYTVNYPAELPAFPSIPNCDIVDRSCDVWINDRVNARDNPYPFCDNARTPSYTCDVALTHLVRCNMNISAIVTTSSESTDYGMSCGRYDEKQETFSCQNVLHSPSQNIFLEKYGDESVCVRHENKWNVYGDIMGKGAGCYTICCRDDSFDISDVNGNAHSCYYNKQTLHISSNDNNIRGMLICPKFQDVCGEASSRCHKRGKCITPNVSNGQVYSNYGMYQLVIGSAISFACFQDYFIRGPSSIVCLGENNFSDNPPKCLKSCRMPVVESGKVEARYNTPLVGDTVTITCNSEYVLYGSRTLACTDHGNWSDDVPKCKIEYQEWSEWGPCSVSCVHKSGHRVRTRGCKKCSNFKWEKEECMGNLLCETDTNKKKDDDENSSMFESQTKLVAIFGSLFSLAAFVIVIIVFLWYFNERKYRKPNDKHSFQESYYTAQVPIQRRTSTRNVMVPKTRSIEECSGYRVSRNNVKQLFNSPPATPKKRKSTDSIDSANSILKAFPRVKYKNRARVFPKRDLSLGEQWPPPSYSESESLKLTIRAARNRVKNNPQLRQLIAGSMAPNTRHSYNSNQVPFQIREEDNNTDHIEDKITAWKRPSNGVKDDGSSTVDDNNHHYDNDSMFSNEIADNTGDSKTNSNV